MAAGNVVGHFAPSGFAAKVPLRCRELGVGSWGKRQLLIPVRKLVHRYRYFLCDKAKIVLAAIFMLPFVVFIGCETALDSGGDLPLTGLKSLQLTARNHAIMAQWSMVSSTQEVPASYEVYCSTSPTPKPEDKYDGDVVRNKNLVTCQITGLENFVTYYVWVKTIFEGLGDAGFSPTEYAIPIPPPPAPGAITVIQGENMLELQWDSVTAKDNEGKDVEIASSYNVYCKEGAGSAVPPEGTMVGSFPNTEGTSGACIFNLAGEGAPPLENGKTYTVWVQAHNSASSDEDTGFAAATGSPKAASAPPTSAPVISAATAGAKKIMLSWQQVPGVPSYRIYYSEDSNFDNAADFVVVPANSPIVNESVTGLHNNTTYYLWIQSLNSQNKDSKEPHSDSVSGIPEAKPALNFSDYQTVIGEATDDFIFAVDLPPSVWFFDGRPSTDRLPRFQEAAIGDLYCDGAAWFVRDRYPDKNFDFVFLNSSHVDNVIPRGQITIGTIMNATKADGRTDKLCLITLKGDKLINFEKRNTGINYDDELEELFDTAANVPHTGHGSSNTQWFPIVSKEVRFTIQYYKPPDLLTWTGPEISQSESEPYYHGWIKDYPYNADYAFTPAAELPSNLGFKGSLTISGKPIDKNKDYRILTSDYVAKGLWYTIFYTDGRDKEVINTPIWQAVAEYIYDMEKVTPASITSTDYRIKIEGGVPLPDPWIPGDLINPNPPVW